MKTVTMLEFRQQTKKIINQVRRGNKMVLTYRGQPVARLEPIVDQQEDKDDPFYTLDRLANTQGRSLSNSHIDKLLYG